MPTFSTSSSLTRRRGRGGPRSSLSALCIRRASVVFMFAVSFCFGWNVFYRLENNDLQSAILQNLKGPEQENRGQEIRDASRDEWKSLHDEMIDGACSKFDHSVRRPKHGCEVNKDTRILYCNFENLRIDTKNIDMVARGGEDLSSNVMGRPEEDEFPTYHKAAFSTPTKPKFDVPDEYRSGHHYLENVLNAFRYPTEKNKGKLDLSCQKTYTGTTLFITRYEYVNLYHTLTDWWNAFFVLPRNTKSKGVISGLFQSEATPSKNKGIATESVPQKPDRVVFLDGHAKGMLDSVWETLFGEYHYIKHMGETAGGGGICFERAIFVPAGYNSPLLKNYKREACEDKGLTTDFADFVLNQYGLSESKVIPGSIVVIDRQPFVSHPRSDPNNAARRFENSEIHELERKLRSIPGVRVKLVRLEKLSFRQQLKLMRETHVLIGIHGAGLSNLLFMDETISHCIEFESNLLEHFSYLSKWKGMDHSIVDLSNNGIHDAVQKVEKYMRKNSSNRK